MHKRREVIGGSITLLICTAVVAFYLIHRPHTFIVTRTAEGFVPKTSFIHKGDTVRFVSTAGAEFWPASDAHPSHNLYPAFDPGRALESSESWSFTFDRAGVWNFHDHLLAEVRGSILVEGDKDESVKNCLASSQDTTKGYCWAAEITATMQQDGLTAGFDAVHHYYEISPEFQNQCHDVMHILGSTAYSEYKKTGTHIARLETSYCGYGFYHGFMEQMLIELGRGYLREANSYCVGLLTDPALPSRGAGESAAAACFHGIGHALFDSLPGDLWGEDEIMAARAIQECETVTEDEEWRTRCVSGVFNSLSIAEGSQTYNLSYQTKNPTALCRSQKASYQQSCYNELAVGYIHHANYSSAAALSFIQHLPGDAKYWGLMAFFDDRVRHDLQGKTVLQLHEETMSFPEEKEREAVIDGVANALSSGGKPDEEYVQMLLYCSLFQPFDARGHCYKRTIDTLSTLYTTSTLTTICNTIPPADQTACASLLKIKTQ